MSTISYDDVGEDLRRIIVSGRLDTFGPTSIASQLVELAEGAKKAVVVDLSAVQYLASIGIGALLKSAKSVNGRGGKMTLVVNNGSTVLMSLHATGVDKLIPIFRNLSEAESAALA
jgi:anti-sigma B factor antagonist